MLFSQRHGGIETNDGKLSGHMQNGLNNSFSHFSFQIVELGGIIPGHTGAVISMIDVLGATGMKIYPFKYHRGITAIIIMILNIDANFFKATDFPAF